MYDHGGRDRFGEQNPPWDGQSTYTIALSIFMLLCKCHNFFPIGSLSLIWNIFNFRWIGWCALVAIYEPWEHFIRTVRDKGMEISHCQMENISVVVFVVKLVEIFGLNSNSACIRHVKSSDLRTCVLILNAVKIPFIRIFIFIISEKETRNHVFNQF